MNRRSIALIPAVLFSLFILFPLHSQNSVRVGVVEFEEKNDIGLENAGVIVAEWVVTEFDQLGLYEVEERLFLEAVLEEQNLMLMGVIDDEQVPQIGQIYGVDAILTGSVMKIGSEISVTGRIINVETAAVMKTASVTAPSLSALQQEVVVLANALGDISRTEWEIREDLEKRADIRLDVGGGPGYAFNNVDYGGFGLQVSLRFDSPWVLAWIDGTPLGDIKVWSSAPW